MRRPLSRLAGLALLAHALLASPPAARAETVVELGTARALIAVPPAPRASLILIPGGDGVLDIQVDGSFSGLKGNQLVRTRGAYARNGFATLTIDRGVDIAAALAHMRAIAKPVLIVATSRGTLRAAEALPAKFDALVLTAGFLDAVRARAKASALPPTLVVHHRQDGCKHTPPGAVTPFADWAGGKVKVVWLDGGTDSGDPCQARGHHGFAGLDATVVEEVSAFVRGIRN